jgi:hypothetical protein
VSYNGFIAYMMIFLFNYNWTPLNPPIRNGAGVHGAPP